MNHRPFVKTILPTSYGYDEPLASLVDIHSRGIDSAWMRKHAAAGVFKHMELKPEDGFSVIHLIAMGASDRYGQNRNADAFLRKSGYIIIPHPKPGVPDRILINRGLIETHGSFEKNARVFRHHKNKDPNNNEGDVLKSAYNTAADRVELLIKVANSKWNKELNDLASGESINFSMSCVLDPSYPVLTVSGYKPISEVKVDDVVFSGEGRWCRVKGINRRQYSGKAVKLCVNGLPHPLEVTADHPMYAKVFPGSRNKVAVMAKTRRYFISPEDFSKAPAGWVHSEHLAAGDRLFYVPIKLYPDRCSIASVELATIMGYYLAEGSLQYNGDRACTVSFSCHTDDSLPVRLPAIVRLAMGEAVTCKLSPGSMGTQFGLTVDVFSTALGEFLRKYVGAGCRQKFICPKLFNSENEVKLSFLGSWMDGDGFVDAKGAHWSTVNYGLALQGRDLLATMGISSSVYKIVHPAQHGIVNCKSEYTEYTLNVSTLEAKNLVPYSEKAARLVNVSTTGRHKPAAMRPCPDGKYAYRVKSVETREVLNVQTYNLEVEGDESYTLAGLISHNCQVPFDICLYCGNKSASRKDYCEHARDFMSAITKEGHQIGVMNDWMKFFDISQVAVPADRIALGLLKAASGNLIHSAAELADELTLFPTELDQFRLDEPGYGVSSKQAVIRKLSDIEKEIEATASGSSPISRLAMAFDSEACPEMGNIADKVLRSQIMDLLGSFADAKISLPFRDFVKLLLGDRFGEAEHAIGEAQMLVPGIFGRMCQPSGEQGIGDFELGNALLPKPVREMIAGMIPSHSIDEGPAEGRVVITILRGKTAPRLLKLPALSKQGSVSELAKRLADAYAMYKLAFLQRVGTENKVLTKLAILQHYVV